MWIEVRVWVSRNCLGELRVERSIAAPNERILSCQSSVPRWIVLLSVRRSAKATRIRNAVSWFWHFVRRTDPASAQPMIVPIARPADPENALPTIDLSNALLTIACANDPTDEMCDRRLSSASMIARTSIP